jgi:hypothetical protein
VLSFLPRNNHIFEDLSYCPRNALTNMLIIRNAFFEQPSEDLVNQRFFSILGDLGARILILQGEVVQYEALEQQSDFWESQ